MNASLRVPVGIVSQSRNQRQMISEIHHARPLRVMYEVPYGEIGGWQLSTEGAVPLLSGREGSGEKRQRGPLRGTLLI